MTDVKKTVAITSLEVAGAVFCIAEMEADLDGIIAFCKELSCPTVVNPWVDETLCKTETDYRAVAKKLNHFGAELLKSGIHFLHHVHGFEFVDFGGKIGMELLVEEFDPRYVNLETDIYWVEHVRVDAVAFM